MPVAVIAPFSIGSCVVAQPDELVCTWVTSGLFIVLSLRLLLSSSGTIWGLWPQA
ncbi:MAG: hypothetical protein F6K42_07280 [Leptolyngbya sp. SIO1D8]|nr:hypothetical protein [Leptolyngbya sp. SIO1D8]